VFNLAEFNRMKGAIVAYPGNFGIPIALIKEMAEDEKVTTIVSGPAQQSSVASIYAANGVNSVNCNYLHAPLNSYWVRDYGPWFIIDGNHEVGVVDFPYNRPRPADDEIPVKVANNIGVNLFGMNLIHTGGNYMTDGMGISASTELVDSENVALSISAIDSLVFRYLGVHTYHLNDDPLGLYIEHIDCWGKFLDVDKILIAQVPVTDYRYADYEAIATYYANEISSYGNNYQVFRVYSPNGQPYTNSFILNRKVYVPVVNGAGAAWNDTALARYAQAMPGYEIIGITQLSSAPWQTTDALHCRVKGMADQEMLHIWHQPLLGLKPVQQAYNLHARIVSAAGHGLIPDSLMVRYRINGGNWQVLLMAPDTNHWFTASIPAQIPGSEIQYYIHAADSSGRSEDHPFIGQADPHVFTVGTLAQLPDEKMPFSSMSLYPNPANGLCFLDFRTAGNLNTAIVVRNTLGQLIDEMKFGLLPAGHHQYRMDVSSWINGIYIVSVEAGIYRRNLRLVVNN
jgi:agmatine/peptidylarginine deiminase